MQDQCARNHMKCNMQHKYKQHHYHHYHYKFSQIQLNNSITKTQLAEQQGLK